MRTTLTKHNDSRENIMERDITACTNISHAENRKYLQIIEVVIESFKIIDKLTMIKLI